MPGNEDRHARVTELFAEVCALSALEVVVDTGKVAFRTEQAARDRAVLARAEESAAPD